MKTGPHDRYTRPILMYAPPPYALGVVASYGAACSPTTRYGNDRRYPRGGADVALLREPVLWAVGLGLVVDRRRFRFAKTLRVIGGPATTLANLIGRRNAMGSGFFLFFDTVAAKDYRHWVDVGVDFAGDMTVSFTGLFRSSANLHDGVRG